MHSAVTQSAPLFPPHTTSRPLWYWTLGDAPGHESCVRSLLDGRGAGYPSLRHALVRLVKDGQDTALRDGGSFAELIFGHLFAVLERDPVCANAHYWCCYPAHAGPSNLLPVLSRFLPPTGPLMEGRYLHLLLRHRPAMKAAFARRHGVPVHFTNQTNAVHLNPEHRAQVRGRRILVLDDFCTRGYSFEWSRLLLERAQASGVVCVSLARCGSTYHRQAVVADGDWSPFHPVRLRESDFAEITCTISPNQEALQPLRRSYQQHYRPASAVSAAT